MPLTKVQELMADFDGVKAYPGYLKLPNGMIIQWGSGTVASATNVTLTFPIEFPNACLTAMTSLHNYSNDLAAGGAYIGQVRNATKTQITIRNLGPLQQVYDYFAIGY